MYAADLHCDTILALWLSELKGEKLSLRGSRQTPSPLHLDLQKMREGEYLLQNFALFTNLHLSLAAIHGGTADLSQQTPGEVVSKDAGHSRKTSQMTVAKNADKSRETPRHAVSEAADTSSDYIDPWYQATEMIRVFREEMAANADLIGQAFTWQDIEENRKCGRMSAILTTEEGEIIQGDLSRLDTLYDFGVRMMTITWNYDNSLGHPNRPPQGVAEDFRNFYRFQPESGRGLTPFGKEAVARMEELGILPDVSHLSDDGFFDVADIVRGPFVASHSNARALCGCARNLTDEMIRTIGEHGGVIGLNYCPSFVMEADDESKCFTSCEALLHHARHIMNVGGREVIALGSDFDGIPRKNLEMENASQVQKLADCALHNGFTSEETEGMFYKNVLRLYREIM